MIVGCGTIRPSGQEEWPLPQKPLTKNITFIPAENDGFYISPNDAEKLANNIDELKAYIDKLELLIDEIRKYYKERLSDQ